MQQWYNELTKDDNKPGAGQAFSVTRYSLGGRLATVFNLLNDRAAQCVVTFNGAGVGLVKDGTLQGALDEFNGLHTSPDSAAARTRRLSARNCSLGPVREMKYQRTCRWMAPQRSGWQARGLSNSTPTLFVSAPKKPYALDVFADTLGLDGMAAPRLEGDATDAYAGVAA